MFTQNGGVSLQFHVFSTPLFLCQLFVLLPAFSCTCAGLFKEQHNSIFYLDLDDALLTHSCVRVTIFFKLNTQAFSFCRYNNTPFPPSPALFPFPLPSNFTHSPFLVPPHDTAVLASGMEMRCLVALCQRGADWTLAWMVQQMFADFFIQISLEYWLTSQGCRERSAVDTCSINPTWCVHVFGCYCMNYHKYESGFSECAIFVFASVSVHAAQESLKIENRQVDLAAFSILLVVFWGMSALCVFSRKQSFPL